MRDRLKAYRVRTRAKAKEREWSGTARVERSIDKGVEGREWSVRAKVKGYWKKHIPALSALPDSTFKNQLLVSETIRNLYSYANRALYIPSKRAAIAMDAAG